MTKVLCWPRTEITSQGARAASHPVENTFAPAASRWALAFQHPSKCSRHPASLPLSEYQRGSLAGSDTSLQVGQAATPVRLQQEKSRG